MTTRTHADLVAKYPYWDRYDENTRAWILSGVVADEPVAKRTSSRADRAAADQDFRHFCEDFDGECCQDMDENDPPAPRVDPYANNPVAQRIVADAVAANAATPKQVAFIAKLLVDKDLTGTKFAGRELPQISKAQAGEAIDALLKLPRLVAEPVGYTQVSAAKAEPVTDGMYLVGETVYKVQMSQTGHLYAKVLVQHGAGVKATFEYAAGAMRIIRPEHRMDLASAKAYGALYGQCVVCGRTLTNEVSIEASIGPVCASRL